MEQTTIYASDGERRISKYCLSHDHLLLPTVNIKGKPIIFSNVEPCSDSNELWETFDWSSASPIYHSSSSP